MRCKVVLVLCKVAWADPWVITITIQGSAHATFHKNDFNEMRCDEIQYDAMQNDTIQFFNFNCYSISTMGQTPCKTRWPLWRAVGWKRVCLQRWLSAFCLWMMKCPSWSTILDWKSGQEPPHQLQTDIWVRLIIRYHLRIFQQLPHQMGVENNTFS